MCEIYKDLLFSCGFAKLLPLELVPGTQESPRHPTECSWLGSSLGDKHKFKFFLFFFLSVLRGEGAGGRERGREREEGFTVILPI